MCVCEEGFDFKCTNFTNVPVCKVSTDAQCTVESFVRHSIIFQTNYINTPSKNREWCVLYMFHYLNMVDMVYVLGRKLPEVANDKHESFIIVSYDTSRLHRVVEYIERVTNVGRCKYTKSMLLRFVSFYSETAFSRIAVSCRISKQYIRVHFLFICIFFHWHSHMCMCVCVREFCQAFLTPLIRITKPFIYFQDQERL